ncbi:MAG: autotransporter outer membrane beta-barrel domain-containing protein, partial [Planctomycetes bacterium]|nr:autotransporter outer membrane beta-barrel domain-containing protein [Planctomycetota bacterium]
KPGWSAADGGLGGGNRVHKTVYAVGVEGGRDFDLGGSFFLTPHVGLDYAYTPGETYHWRTTTDGLASQSYWEIPLGVTVSKVLDYGSWQVIPKVDVTMVNAIGNMDVMNAQPGYAYRTAKGWQVAGIGGDHVGARLSAGVDARIGGRTTVEFDYTYEGRKNYNEHRLSAMLGWSF